MKPDIVDVQFSDRRVQAKCCRECTLIVEAMIQTGYNKDKPVGEKDEAI